MMDTLLVCIQLSLSNASFDALYLKPVSIYGVDQELDDQRGVAGFGWSRSSWPCVKLVSICHSDIIILFAVLNFWQSLWLSYWRWAKWYPPITYSWTGLLILDHSSRWELDKFKNCWNKSFKTSKILTLLYQELSNLFISQRDTSGQRLGALSNNRWSGVQLLIMHAESPIPLASAQILLTVRVSTVASQ